MNDVKTEVLLVVISTLLLLISLGGSTRASANAFQHKHRSDACCVDPAAVAESRFNVDAVERVVEVAGEQKGKQYVMRISM